jgi:hypothetical protein
LGYAWQPNVQYHTIHEQSHQAPAAVGGASPQYQPGMQAFCDAYGNMKV